MQKESLEHKRAFQLNDCLYTKERNSTRVDLRLVRQDSRSRRIWSVMRLFDASIVSTRDGTLQVCINGISSARGGASAHCKDL